MVAIVGPSGSGKTTLLNCLSGLDAFDGGQVVVDGQDLSTMSDRTRTAYRRDHMGFVFQAFNLLPVLSAVENVEIPLLLQNVSSRDSRRRALEMLETLGLAHRANHRPDQLSGGEQQRVAVARALVHKPAVVWADEPTGNLDTEVTLVIVGTTAIFATQVLSDSFVQSSTSAAYLSWGRVDLVADDEGRFFDPTLASGLAADPRMQSSLAGVQAGVELPSSVVDLDRGNAKGMVTLIGFDPDAQV